MVAVNLDTAKGAADADPSGNSKRPILRSNRSTDASSSPTNNESSSVVLSHAAKAAVAIPAAVVIPADSPQQTTLTDSEARATSLNLRQTLQGQTLSASAQQNQAIVSLLR